MIYCYHNGNTFVTIDSYDGTRHMFTNDDEFDLEFPVSMDVNLTQRCNGGCPFCYAKCTPDGKHADMETLMLFLDTVPAYVEMALQVNDLTHPDLLLILEELKKRKIFANITVNQIHFEQKEELIASLLKRGLISAFGVSLRNPTPDFIERIEQYRTAVIHVINGIVTAEDLCKLANNNLKVLILGYKDKGRGHEYLGENGRKICQNQAWLKENLNSILNLDWFNSVCFDNLALEQLEVRDLIGDSEWERFYQGDEGSCSMYINLVDGTFGVSSLVPPSEMLPITNDIREMFSEVKRIA